MLEHRMSRPSDPARSGFAVHGVGRDLERLPTSYDDPGGAWPRLLAEAELGDALLTDADVEAVATDPLTLVLTGAAGPRIQGTMREAAPFVITLDGARLYAGMSIFVGTARMLLHPLLHVLDFGSAVHVRLVASIGARTDTPLSAPPALLEHFRGAGKLLPPGSPPGPRSRRRRLLAAVTNTKPGDPTSQLEARWDDEAGKGTLTASFRRPGTAVGQWDATETVELPAAELEALWTIAMTMGLFATVPGPYPHPSFEPPPVIHPPRFRFAIEIERVDGTILANDRAWSSPSPADRTVAPFFSAAGALGRRLARDVPVRYFPGDP
jgi:hypothetical protein